MAKALSFENVGKLYNLGVVGTGMFTNDVFRWFKTAILRQEDPYLKVGEVNDRSKAGESKFVWALKDITFDVEEGDVVGIIGKNGAGKSTLLKLLSRVTGPTTGIIKAKGRIGSLLEVGTGFHPELTGRENIYMNGAILGMTKREINSKLDEIIDFSGCERYIDTPVKRYSSGMMVRLGFAVAAHLEPEILVVDEVLAVGDAEFQKKAIGKMQDVSKGEGRTVLFVSHNMASIRALCNKCILLNNGMIRYQGDTSDIIEKYLHENVQKKPESRIVDNFKLYNEDIVIYDFTINGNSSSIVNLEYPDYKLEIEVKGHFKGKTNLDIETYFYTENEVLVAKKTPALSTGETLAVDGEDFVLKNVIILPEEFTNGTYYLKWDLTHPKVQTFASTETLVELNVSGKYTPQGISVDNKIFGLLYL